MARVYVVLQHLPVSEVLRLGHRNGTGLDPSWTSAPLRSAAKYRFVVFPTPHVRCSYMVTAVGRLRRSHLKKAQASR